MVAFSVRCEFTAILDPVIELRYPYTGLVEWPTRRHIMARTALTEQEASARRAPTSSSVVAATPQGLTERKSEVVKSVEIVSGGSHLREETH